MCFCTFSFMFFVCSTVDAWCSFGVQMTRILKHCADLFNQNVVFTTSTASPARRRRHLRLLKVWQCRRCHRRLPASFVFMILADIIITILHLLHFLSSPHHYSQASSLLINLHYSLPNLAIKLPNRYLIAVLSTISTASPVGNHHHHCHPLQTSSLPSSSLSPSNNTTTTTIVTITIIISHHLPMPQ